MFNLSPLLTLANVVLTAHLHWVWGLLLVGSQGLNETQQTKKDSKNRGKRKKILNPGVCCFETSVPQSVIRCKISLTLWATVWKCNCAKLKWCLCYDFMLGLCIAYILFVKFPTVNNWVRFILHLVTLWKTESFRFTDPRVFK